jgi:hypothetical protein
MPEVDTKLAARLRQAKNATRDAPQWFAFVAKGTTDGVFLVGMKKIPAKEVSEVKASSGGKQVYRGRCFGEGDELICEVPREPPATLDKQVKAVIHRDAGLVLKVRFRVAPDLAEEEEEGAETAPMADKAPPVPPTPVPPPGDAAARFVSRLKTLMPALQKAQTANHPLSPEVKTRVGEAQGFARNKDFDHANGVLDKLEGLVKQVLGAPAAAPPPGAPPQPPTTPTTDAAARFTARLKAMLPDLQKAQAANHPLSPEVKTRVGEAQGFGRNKDFGQANGVLDKLEGLVKQVLGAPAGDTAARFTARLKAMLPDLQKAQTANHPLSPEVKTRIGEGQTLAQHKDFGQANAVLDKLEALVKQVLAVPGAVPVSQTVTVEIAKPDVVAELAEKTDKLAALRRSLQHELGHVLGQPHEIKRDMPRKVTLHPTDLAGPPREHELDPDMSSGIMMYGLPTKSYGEHTNDLLKAVAGKSLPERIEDVPGDIVKLVPKFLMTMASELSQTSQGLQSGAALPAQDQMLSVADTLNAAMRSMKKWEDFLSQGEAAGKRLDELEKAKQGGDEGAYAESETVLASYNAARAGGLAEQARTLKLVHALLAEYKGLQAVQPKA